MSNNRCVWCIDTVGVRQGRQEEGGLCNTERERETHKRIVCSFYAGFFFSSLPTHIHKSYMRGVGDVLVKGVLPTINSDMGGG